MFLEFLRSNKYASFVLLLFRLFIGFKWAEAGWDKLTNGHFDASGLLNGAIANPNTVGWWASFLKNFALPNVGLFNFIVPWGEFLVGLGLIIGLFTVWAAFFGLVMNFAFLLSGVVSVNPQMIILTLFILLASTNAGKIGLDSYVRPYLQKRFKKGELKI